MLTADDYLKKGKLREDSSIEDEKSFQNKEKPLPKDSYRKLSRAFFKDSSSEATESIPPSFCFKREHLLSKSTTANSDQNLKHNLDPKSEENEEKVKDESPRAVKALKEKMRRDQMLKKGIVPQVGDYPCSLATAKCESGKKFLVSSAATSF